MEFMHEEEHATCPYHLKRLVRRAAVTSCTPNIAQSESEDTSHNHSTQIDYILYRKSFRKAVNDGKFIPTEELHNKKYYVITAIIVLPIMGIWQNIDFV